MVQGQVAVVCTYLLSCLLLTSQEDYSAGVRHYDKEEYGLAITFLERALEGYYAEDEDCQIMCEGPQRFEEHEYLEYKAGLYEAIAGEIFLHLIGSHPTDCQCF